MASIESELAQFVAQCRKQEFSESEMRSICQPILWHWRLLKLRKWVQWLLLPAVLVYLLWSCCDSCAWTLSALGRLLLIELLPYWDWTPYYNAKCLIERESERSTDWQPKALGRHETLWENCALCEQLGMKPLWAQLYIADILNPFQRAFPSSLMPATPCWKRSIWSAVCQLSWATASSS